MSLTPVTVILRSGGPVDWVPCVNYRCNTSADFPGLPDIVEATYRTLVAGLIAGEGRFFNESELIAP